MNLYLIRANQETCCDYKFQELIVVAKNKEDAEESARIKFSTDIWNNPILAFYPEINVSELKEGFVVTLFEDEGSK